MNILALDCATRTGFAWIKDGKLVESGVQDFSKRRGESNGGMFFRFRTWLSNILDGMKGDNDDIIVVYEQAHHRGGAATEIAVNLTGRVQEACASRSIEFATVHTATLKKFATGKGKADKSEMVTWAANRTGKLIADDNEADAIAIAYWADENYGGGGDAKA